MSKYRKEYNSVLNIIRYRMRSISRILLPLVLLSLMYDCDCVECKPELHGRGLEKRSKY